MGATRNKPLKHRYSTWRKLITGFLWLIILGWFCSLAAVIIFASRNFARPADAIVVLGAAQYDGKPSPVLKGRLDHSIKLWNKKVAKRIIFTGGRGKGDTTTEATVGMRYARKNGVPDSAIFMENEGRTTNESMRAVADIMRAQKLSSAVLVSDPYHMFRLKVLARKYGFKSYTSPTTTVPVTSDERNKVIVNESVKAPLSFFIER